jgi:hypothetical protein
MPGTACPHRRRNDLRVIASTPAAQLDPVHKADAWFFERDRCCRKGGLRSARFTNAHCRRPSAPLRKVIANPVQCGGQATPDWMLVLSRHISIMHLPSLGYGHHCDTRSHVVSERVEEVWLMPGT